MNERCCLWCGKVLKQREFEPDYGFIKRNYCDKSHASFHNNEKRKPKKRSVSCFMSPLTV
jgi:hypothetical protein